jgi:hypothetical protein
MAWHLIKRSHPGKRGDLALSLVELMATPTLASWYLTSLREAQDRAHDVDGSGLSGLAVARKQCQWLEDHLQVGQGGFEVRVGFVQQLEIDVSSRVNRPSLTGSRRVTDAFRQSRREYYMEVSMPQTFRLEAIGVERAFTIYESTVEDLVNGRWSPKGNAFKEKKQIAAKA